jgi:hypothetical protein
LFIFNNDLQSARFKSCGHQPSESFSARALGAFHEVALSPGEIGLNPARGRTLGERVRELCNCHTLPEQMPIVGAASLEE